LDERKVGPLMVHWMEASGDEREHLMATEIPAMALCNVPPSPKYALEPQLGIPIKNGGVPISWSAVPDHEATVARYREQYGSDWSSHMTTVISSEWMAMNAMFYTPSPQGDLTELVSVGDAFIVTTPERLILSIVSGQSKPFGDLAAKKWALLISWPLKEINKLSIGYQKARFGDKRSVSEFIIGRDNGFVIQGRSSWSSVLKNLEDRADKGQNAFDFLSKLAQAVDSARDRSTAWTDGSDENDKRFTYSEIAWSN
jgi:hypothetical protein